MGRDKKNPKPFDATAFATFVKTASEVLAKVVPLGNELLPGVAFGALRGTATGAFGALFFHSLWTKLIQHEALELEVLLQGRLHPDCTPERPLPCPRCGLAAFGFPEDPILEAVSLPANTDLFRLSDFETIFIATERFVEAVRRLELDEVDIREVPLR